MNIEFKFIDKILPKRSLFGFEVLNTTQSLTSAYFFIFIEHLLLPSFGFENVQIKAGLLFVFLINLSIFILLVNSLIRVSKFNLILFLLQAPLIIYTPNILNKIFISSSSFIRLYSR